MTLEQVDGWVRVALVQEQIPTDDESKFQFHIGCQMGWSFYLANLKSLYEGGIDLRYKKEKFTQVINS